MRKQPFFGALAGLALCAPFAAAQSFVVSGPAAGGDVDGDLWLDAVDFGGGVVRTPDDWIFVADVTDFDYSGATGIVRTVSGPNTTGTTGFHALEAEDGDAGNITQADLDAFNARVLAVSQTNNLNTYLDINTSAVFSYVLHFERELLDDDAASDANGEITYFERGPGGSNSHVLFTALDENGNQVGTPYVIYPNTCTDLTPPTNIRYYHASGNTAGTQTLEGRVIDLSDAFGVTTVHAIRVSNPTVGNDGFNGGETAPDIKVFGIDTISPDCNDNDLNDRWEIAQGLVPDLDMNGVPDECEPGWTPFCEGDGAQNGGLDCPCLNNATGGSLPAGCVNSTGNGGSMTASGVPSLTNDSFSLLVQNVPTSTVVFFQGTALFGGQDGTPFGSGIRCVGGQVIRISKFTPATPPPHVLPNADQMDGLSTYGTIFPGDVRFYQAYYRDPGSTICSPGYSTTNAIRVVWGL